MLDSIKEFFTGKSHKQYCDINFQHLNYQVNKLETELIQCSLRLRDLELKVNTKSHIPVQSKPKPKTKKTTQDGKN